jgi:glycosyltransferase involved in cell wall biosynthesis
MPESLPKISVITPSYNQGAYIEQTILSVIFQGYDNLEYIVLDGGSSDESVEVIKKYEKYINYWHSKKDNGQAAAINEGFGMATGEILCWLNSDDVLLPGTLLKIGRMFASIKEPALIFGNCLHFHQTRFNKVRGSDVVKWQKSFKLSLCDYIIQPSAFWNRDAWQITGRLNEDLCYTMDWDWFIRAERAGVKFIPINEYLSLFRLLDVHKTSIKGRNNPRHTEMAKIYGIYNNKNVEKAFSKLKKYANRSKFFHNVVYTTNLYNITFLRRIIHISLFPYISFNEYDGISRM